MPWRKKFTIGSMWPGYCASMSSNALKSNPSWIQASHNLAKRVVFLTGKQGISQPPPIAEKTSSYSSENIWPEPGDNHEFGAAENN